MLNFCKKNNTKINQNYMEKTIWDPISQFNIATFLCLSQARPGFPTSYDVEYIQASLSDLTQIE